MRVLIALEDVGTSPHLFQIAEDTFGHTETVDFVVAYPEDAVTRRPEEYEGTIDEWRTSVNGNTNITSLPLSGSEPYNELVIDAVDSDKTIQHLLIGPQRSPLAQRLFGDAPSSFFVDGPVPITVAHDPS